MKRPELDQVIEALLFVAAEPQSAAQLATAADAAEEDVSSALDRLGARLKAASGLRLSQAGGSYQLITAPEMAATVERFLGAAAKTELSRPALETLAIIVYRQPVTKLQIEQIRGIASDQTLKNLLQRELIMEAGRSNEPGKPIMYRASHRLLHHLGIASFGELPSFESLTTDPRAD